MRSAYSCLAIFCLLSHGWARPEGPILSYQDSLGQYSFGYSTPNSARSEVRTLTSETQGSYSYFDDKGVVQVLQYTADNVNGFNIKPANLPLVPYSDTIVVPALRAVQLQTPEQVMEKEESRMDEKLTETKNLDTMKSEMAEGSIKKRQAENVETNSKVQEPEISDPVQSKMQTLIRIPLMRIPHGDLAIEPLSMKEPIQIQAPLNTSPGTTSSSSPGSDEKMAKTDA